MQLLFLVEKVNQREKLEKFLDDYYKKLDVFYGVQWFTDYDDFFHTYRSMFYEPFTYAFVCKTQSEEIVKEVTALSQKVNGKTNKTGIYLLEADPKYKQFRQVMDECLGVIAMRKKKSLLVRGKGRKKKERIAYRDIMYIEIEKKTISVHMHDGEIYQIRQNISSIAKELEARENFLFCHQSFIVNMDYIVEGKGNFFVMENGDEISIRVREAKPVREQYARYLETHGKH